MPLLSETRRILALLGLTLTAITAGCYTVNQPDFEAHIAAVVSEGMPFAAAIANLTKEGFVCSAVSSASSEVTCTRYRHSLLPSTCIERVNLSPRDKPPLLGSVDIRPIVCASL